MPLFEFVLVFEFEFGVRVLLRPRLPLVVGEAGGIGPAAVPGVAGSAGMAGATAGSAGVAAVAGVARPRVRRVRVVAAVGVKEQVRPEPGTLISVNRSPDFFARIDTIVGTDPGCPPEPATDSPICNATAV